MTVFTIGHSTLPFDAFLGMLRQAGVDLLVDVRTVPRSRRNPQYYTAVPPAALAPERSRYRHLPALRGLTGRSRPSRTSANVPAANAPFPTSAHSRTAPGNPAGLQD